MIFANIFNAALNWIFIYGNFGADAMGAEGAALATSIVRWFTFFALTAYALVVLDRKHFGIVGAIHNAAALSQRLRRFGYPMGIAHALESSAFASMTLFAGLLGATQVAGFQITFNLVAIVFMTAIGFSAAASIRVGNAIGRGDAPGVQTAGWIAVALACIVLLCIGVTLQFNALAFAQIYTNDLTVLAVTVPCIAIAAFAVVPD